MGESVMAASSDEDKIGDRAALNRSLEVSVSFGRFENDSLSWEKWSSFSPNKYLEEVEKCATPGSVAMKKAYFEAHYKKIAARKAEQLQQEKQKELESLGSNDQNGGDSIEKACGSDSEFDILKTRTFEEENKQDTKLDGELDTGHFDEPGEVAVINSDGQGLSVERMEEELGSRIDGLTLHKPEEAPLVREVETPSMGTQESKELPKNPDQETKSIPVVKEENVKVDRQKDSQKTSSMSKIRDMARTKKKPVSPVTKSPQISNPKGRKMVPTAGALSTLKSYTKKPNVSPSPKSKSPSMAGNKKVAPKSLHMSLTMDTTNSNPAPLTPTHPITARSSLIMEKMKDKEIIKRVFKTFQNNFNQSKSSAEEKSSAAKQAPSKGMEVKVSSSMTPRNENTKSFNAVSMDKKSTVVAPSSFGSNSNERAKKQKELSKKLEEKSNPKEVKKSTCHQTKSKEEKDAEIRKLRQSLNSKAVPMRGFYRGQKVSKSSLDKEGSKKTLGI